MIRKYGVRPYRVVAVHGGPGALGSAGALAQTLGARLGTIEPIQSRHSMDDLIKELRQQIGSLCTLPVVLVGHSFGAVLCAEFARRYPQTVSAAIVIGCPPLTDEFARTIETRRRANQTEEQARRFAELVRLYADGADTARFMDELEQVSGDDFCTLPIGGPAILGNDAGIFRVWSEVARGRNEGALLRTFVEVADKLTLIQGERDPHPWQGVTEPLADAGKTIEHFVLPDCGHTPWREKFAREAFYRILFAVIERRLRTSDSDR